MSVTSIDLNPPTLTLLTTETFPFTVEWVDLIGTNDVSVPEGLIYDDANGVLAVDGFVNNFGTNGTQAQYIIDGTKLQGGHTYTAILSVMANGGQIFKGRMTIQVTR